MGSIQTNPRDSMKQTEVEVGTFCGVPIGCLQNNNYFLNRWQQNAISFCIKYQSNASWTLSVIKLLGDMTNHQKNHTLRQNFKRQFDQLINLRSLSNLAIKSNLSTEQIQKFKKNFKESVFLHLNQIKKSYSQVTKQNPRIMTAINPQTITNLKCQNNTILKSEKFYRSRINLISQLNKNTIDRSYVRNSVINLRQSIIKLDGQSMSLIFNNEMITKQNASNLQAFVQCSSLIQKHINNPQHQINLIIDCFFNSIFTLYQLQSEEDHKLSEEQIQKFIQEIKIFIALLVEMVRDFYNLDELQRNDPINFYLIYNEQNLLTIVSTILFKNQKFYFFVFKVVKKFHQDIENKFYERFKYLHGRLPQQFQINAQYCLKYEKINTSINESQQIQSQSQKTHQQQINPELPYKACSQILQKLQHTKAPIVKMKLIMQCAQKLISCITQHYQKINKNITNNKIDADQILSLFRYILSISRIENISTHLFLIQNFATDNQKMSLAGYYFSVMTCAMSDYCNQTISKIGDNAGSSIS